MSPLSSRLDTARARGLGACECCGLVSQAAPRANAAPACPRCGCALHVRKPRSLQRTTAFLMAAVVLYIPANLLPVMTTESVFGPYQHTLLGGIAELWLSGSTGLALIVFIASIVVPVLKIAALAMLVWTARRASRWRQQARAKVYRVIESVGHWSMLDVFVVVLLVGMVRFGAFASVRPEAGLLAFGAVVVLTMLASASFDPRLIWPAQTDVRNDG
ncbi:MAG: paraquat-inducible protein A [Methylibium sp.]|uniref:paraquat-inducible protein A n=1 Tax=Methylibium sp. TaxID=2067992 RepID=UPI0018118F8F|nr:paraquat-inducible protein A [Methylibium sp.]MBA2724221.1 paraquat-inducible protein A [Methylibium sp.]MBA3589166.1 paraquat-inducible protein A [Methylibium sp.]